MSVVTSVGLSAGGPSLRKVPIGTVSITWGFVLYLDVNMASGPSSYLDFREESPWYWFYEAIENCLKSRYVLTCRW